jgi:hypothetical protein
MKPRPGPWKVQTIKERSGQKRVYLSGDDLAIVDESGSTVAYLYETNWGFGIDKANAQLLAGSPDLLDACEALVEYVGEQWLKEWDNRPNCLRMGEGAIERAKSNCPENYDPFNPACNVCEVSECSHRYHD